MPCVVVENGKEINAYLLYVESGGQHNNDIWTVAHCDTGIVRHYNTKQVRYPKNQTFEINEKDSSQKIKKSRKSNSNRTARRKG